MYSADPGLKQGNAEEQNAAEAAGDAAEWTWILKQRNGCYDDAKKAVESAGGLWHPAPGFARAFDLPERIPRYERSGYEYELGSLAYWYAGPSVALIYQASRDETVVPVVPIGKITFDIYNFFTSRVS